MTIWLTFKNKNSPALLVFFIYKIFPSYLLRHFRFHVDKSCIKELTRVK